MEYRTIYILKKYINYLYLNNNQIIIQSFDNKILSSATRKFVVFLNDIYLLLNNIIKNIFEYSKNSNNVLDNIYIKSSILYKLNNTFYIDINFINIFFVFFI